MDDSWKIGLDVLKRGGFARESEMNWLTSKILNDDNRLVGKFTTYNADMTEHFRRLSVLLGNANRRGVKNGDK
jgi:hypothetical protein